MTTNGPGSTPHDPYEPLPMAPAVSERDLTIQGPRPKSVETAFLLWVVSAVLSLVGGVLSIAFGGTDEVREAVSKQLRESGSSASAKDIDAAVSVGIAFAAIISVAWFAVYLLFAFKMRAGRNWARVTLTVLGGLSIVVTLITLAGATSTGLSVVLGLIGAVLIAGAIFFMFRPDAKPHFEPVRRG